MTSWYSRFRHPWALGAAALAFAIVNVAIWWPGVFDSDSEGQLAQALAGSYDDWHPPIMAVIWACLGASAPAMLVLQSGLHWFGFWSLAESVRRKGRSPYHWAVLAVGLSPIALKFTGVFQKDTLLESLFIAGFGLSSLKGGHVAGSFLGTVGMLCRGNAVFALPPLLFARARRMGLVRLVVLSVVIAAALVPASAFVNHTVLNARRSGVERSLQLFDIAGIAHFSHDASFLPKGAERAGECYTPYFWDSFRPCGVPLIQLPPITGNWLSAIAAHPVAYAMHRIAHFNIATFFAVPPMPQCVYAASQHQCEFTRTAVIKDFVAKNALLWPCLWLAIGLMFLLSNPERLPRNMAVSGLIYGLAYAVVSVASNFRYFYWTEIAVQAAIVYHLASGGRLRWRPMVSAAAVILVIGYGARIALLGEVFTAASKAGTAFTG